MDVGSAFLRGMTFAELSTMSGEKPREVSFTPPAGADKYFRELPGMASYNSITHVLRLLKPAYGLRDAPKAWRTRLDIALRALGGLPIPTDAALYVFRDDGRLSLLLSCHVDDLKGAGTPKAFAALRDGLEKQFGKLTIKQGEFEHCGIRYKQTPESVSMTQHHYADQLRLIDTSGMPMDKIDQKLDEHQLGLFMSLLGGLAWLNMTRCDCCVYTQALQRAVSVATLGHIKKLNMVVKWVKRKPAGLVYRRLVEPLKMVCISDSAFRKEDATGLAMRGSLVALCESRPGTPGGSLHLLEWYSRRQRRITRSTYAAELQGLADGLEQTRVICFALCSIVLANVSVRQLMAMEDRGALPLCVEAVTDCRSLFDSLASEEIRTPTEGSLIMVLHAMKELLRTFHFRVLWWCTTGEMAADGLNKGAVSRQGLLHLMATGSWVLRAERRAFSESVHVPLRGPLATLAAAVETSWHVAAHS